jgi:TonB family protein
MGATPGERNPQNRPATQSRDLAREQWNTRMSWSMMAATAAHASMFAFWPTEVVPAPIPDLAMDLEPPTYVSFYDLPVEPDLAPGTMSVPLRAGSAPLTPEAPEQPGVTREDLVDLEEDLRNRLVRGARYVPTIETLGFERIGGAPISDSTTIAGDMGAGEDYPDEYSTLPGLSAMDLERLSALRPDVALEVSSNWVLVRNPLEVGTYMRRTSPREDADPEATGSVSVALWVSASGSVEWAEIVGSSGRSDLDDIALNLFSEVVSFRPARLEGRPMPMSAIFTINFPW